MANQLELQSAENTRLIRQTEVFEEHSYKIQTPSSNPAIELAT